MVNVKKTRGRKIVKKRMVVKKVPRVSRTLDKAIKKVINRQAETKSTAVDEIEYPFIANNNFLQNSQNLSDAFNMNQGTGDGERIGNSINCTKAVLNLQIRRNNQLTAAANNRPCVVSVFVGYLKNNRGESPNSYFGSIFQDGNSVLPWNGTMLRTLRVVNRQMFSVCHRYDFKIGLSTATGGAYNNNDFPALIRKKIPLKEMLGKVTFTDDGTAATHNKDLWIFCSYCNIDDSIDAISTDVNNRQVDIQYFVDVQYKDF